ncbi:MAG: metallopeptidase TldD-related protein [Oligoflexales bacterium]
MKEHFLKICDNAFSSLRENEHLFSYLSAESSDFCRFNKGLIRQLGNVQQAYVYMSFISRQRIMTKQFGFTFDVETDTKSITDFIATSRNEIDGLPEDPYLTFSQIPVRESNSASGTSATKEIVTQVADLARGSDFVGFLANGTMMNGCKSSVGHELWNESAGHNLGWSIYAKEDKAIKGSYADAVWDSRKFSRLIEDNRRNVAILDRSAKKLAPGTYRVFLEPSAMWEIIGLLCWGGFSYARYKETQSPLRQLYDNHSHFSPLLTVSQKLGALPAVAPQFNHLGFTKKKAMNFIDKGRPGELLVSPRSAKEYGVESNGADSSESPVALVVEGGGLRQEEALERLGTGIWIGNLWYLNFSDKKTCGATGMTRFGSFWVEDGKIVAPIEVMRFDDSMYETLGRNLEDLTQDVATFYSDSTYSQRSRESIQVPGALISGLRFTL